ncbi:hypothetical protein [Magnetospirillum molischianum]|uniref:Glycine zipper domain-containing protein n=1 Tax=Magnetospirillum molischianum DSM 120 TaxID=1150626 RepID=H8FX86_MAGML|nr:hypothetical protein [Magnetospirillum molischianum]CCG42974.1 conserved hypothetical protein [Magnetospirillum molischianum DSM 120]
MRPIAIVLATTLILIGVTGCSDMKRWEQRALSGGAIGAAAGGGIAYVAGGPVLGAALLGGAAGAAIGGLTADNGGSHKK